MSLILQINLQSVVYQDEMDLCLQHLNVIML